MWVKRGTESSIKEVVERNTHLTEAELLFPEKSPHLFHLDEAAALIRDAAARKKKFYIMGDYDADGVTATSILYMMLKMYAPINVTARLPRRFSEGYGLNPSIVDEFEEDSFLITVDNGIAAVEAVKKAKDKGITVLIVDHHLQPEDGILPNADCIIDPNTDYDTESSFRGYCGAGLAYRIAEKLLPGVDLSYLRALAAIGTVADVMTLTHDNRNIVLDGLKIMSTPNNRKFFDTGLVAILNRLDLLNSEVTAEDIGFRIGPVLNAAGRMRDDGAYTAFLTLISDDEFEANEMAKLLIDINDERKALVKDSITKAESIITDECLFGDRPMIIAGEFHEGIVGILAGRIAESYKTPVLVLSKTSSGWKGSGRSYGGVHLKELLDSANDLLTAYGGHAGAVGLTVSEENLEPLRERLIENIGSCEEADETEDDFYDLEIEASDVPAVYEELSKYAPYGEGNPKIVFKINGFRLAPKRGKFSTRLGDGSIVRLFGSDCDAIGFGLADRYEMSGSPRLLNLYGVISPNSFNGIIYKQIEMKDFEKKSEPLKPSSLMDVLSRKMAGFNETT